MKSKFGKGFVYNLFLFAKHFEKDLIIIENETAYGVWFNSATEHFCELQIPKQFKNTEIGKLAKWLKNTGIEYHLSVFSAGPTKEQFEEFFNKCEELMMLIDKEFGLKTIKANWN